MKTVAQKDKNIRPLGIEEKISVVVKTIMEIPTREIKRKYFFALVDAVKDDKTLTYDIHKRAFGNYIGGNGKDISSIQGWMKARILKDLKRTSRDVALDYIRIHRIRETQQAIGYFRDIASKIKDKVVKDVNYHKAHPSAKRYKSDKALAPSIGKTPIEGMPNAVQQKDDRIAAKIEAIRDTPLPVKSQITPQMMGNLLASYRSDIGNMKATQLVDRLLDTLKTGMDAPSIVMGQGRAYEKKGEQKYLPQHHAAFRALVHTSVYDHTYNVLKHVLKLAQDKFKDSMKTFGPVYILTTLAHDIGKIPSIRAESLKQALPHEDISASNFHRCCIEFGLSEELKKTVMRLIYQHHGYGMDTDELLKVFTQAEALARTEEIRKKEPSLVQKDLKDWMEIDRLGQIMLPEINVVRNRKWQLITHRSSVYCMWGFIMDSLVKLALEKNVIDYRLLRRKRGDDTDTILREAVEVFRSRKLLDSNIPEGNFSQTFIVETSKGMMEHARFNLIVLKPEVFNMQLDKIEARKTDYLPLITDMRLIG